MALKIGLSTYVSAGFLNPVRWDLHEAGPGGTQGVLVDSHAEVGPHGQIYNFAFTSNIKDINYLILFYDVPGGVGLGNLVKAHEATPSTSTVTGDEDVELIVDGGESYDPISGTNEVVVPQLHDKDFYLVQRAFGQLLQVRTPEFIWDNANNKITLSVGQTFNPSDTWFAKIRAKFIVNPAGTVGGSSVYKDVLFKDANYIIDPLDWAKLIIVDGASTVVTLQLGNIVDIVEKIPLFIESVGTAHKNVIIKASPGENIIASGLISNTFILGRGTRATIIKLGSSLYGFTDDLDIKRRGQLEWGYYVGLNRLWADGSEYLAADYPGLKKAIDAMPVANIVTYTAWAASQLIGGATVFPNKGKFAISNDGLSFKVPDWRNMALRALRYSDATVDADRVIQGAGGYQHFAVGEHDHFLFKNGQDGGSPYISQGHSTGGNLGYSMNGSNGTPDFGKSGKPLKPDGTLMTGETTGKNNALIPLIIT